LVTFKASINLLRLWKVDFWGRNWKWPLCYNRSSPDGAIV
jgi:hypothetical protein